MKYTMKFFLLMTVAVISIQTKAQGVRPALTYINITKPYGGPVSNGDILEIRAFISVLNGTTITDVRFNGAVPSGTTYVSGSLAIKNNLAQTNVTNTGVCTDATGDDRAEISGSAVTFRLGQGANATTGGNIQGGVTDPRHGSASSIVAATFRVRVTQPNETIFTINNNAFAYSGASFSLPTINVLASIGFNCGATDQSYNAITADDGGTFGSGTTHNGPATTSVPAVGGFAYQAISTGSPIDGNYAVVKNTSADQGTTRAFSWDIIGDHTGMGNTSAGNAPSPAGANGGYMLLVNAAYSPSIIYQSTVTGLFPNSTYTFEFWIRNVSPGANKVLPSLTVSVGGTDMYQSGQVDYGTAWYRRTVTFLSTAGGSATISMRNNSPGGSGNDWALDDVSMRQCLIVLPASIDAFRGQKSDNGVVLFWEASNETNVKEYVIQYSTDGKNFQDAGSVPSTNKGGTYTYNDVRAIAGEKMYYRIKAVDTDFRVNYTGVIVIRGTISNSVIRVTPNPSASLPTFQMMSARNQQVQITVRDASGRVVNHFSQSVQKGSNIFKMSASPLKSGLYFVTAVQSDGSLLNDRFIVAN